MADNEQQIENNDQQLQNQAQAEAEQQEITAREIVLESEAQEMEELALAEQEAEEANQLASIRESEAESIQQQANQILTQGMGFQNPSSLKWGILFGLAILNDIIDLLALTGVGEILSWMISLGLTALILIILWMTDGELKRAHAFASSVGDIAQQSQISSQVQQLESNIRSGAEGIAKRLNKIPGFKNIKVRSSPRKNPLARALMGSAVESIPYIGMINLITVWILFSYLAERSAFKEAQQSAEDVSNQLLTSASELV